MVTEIVQRPKYKLTIWLPRDEGSTGITQINHWSNWTKLMHGCAILNFNKVLRKSFIFFYFDQKSTFLSQHQFLMPDLIIFHIFVFSVLRAYM